MKCSGIIDCKSSAGWARGWAPINIWVFTLHSFIAWDTGLSQLRARDQAPGASGQVKIKYRESLASRVWWWPPGVTFSQCHDTRNVSRRPCVPGNWYSSAIRDDSATNLYNCRMKYPPTFIFVWPMITLSDHPGVSCHNSDCHPVIMGAVR